MMFKQSKYNRIIQVQDNVWWMHNILSGSECLISQEERQLLDNLDNQIDESKTLISDWYEMGFLVYENVDEDACMELERKIAMYSSIGEQFGLVIAPTMDCNARCFYCYENDTRAVCYMNHETERALVEYIRNMIPGKKKVFISWFGGEPLLCYDLIKRVSKEIITLCMELGIEYEAELTTNGYYLNEIIDELEDLKINDTQITIDGYQDVYEKRKKYINCPNAWNIVTDYIFQYSLQGYHMTLRMNFDKENLKSIKKAVKYFVTNKKWNNNISIYFYPLEPMKESDQKICFQEEDYAQVMNELYQYLYDIGYYENHETALDFQRLILPCYGGILNTTAVDYKGNIYQCQHLLCNEQYKIGSIFENGIAINQNVLQWYDGKLPEKCKTCDVIPLCQGGCVTKRKLGQECYLCHMMKYRIGIQEKLKIDQLKKLFN